MTSEKKLRDQTRSPELASIRSFEKAIEGLQEELKKQGAPAGNGRD